MGLPSGLAMPPGYLDAQAQQAFAQAAQQLNAQVQNYSLGNLPPPAISMSGLETKVQRKISQLVDQLPMRICSRIRVTFVYAHEGNPARFVVTFDNQRTLEFQDVDAFPADEHVARIALECP